MTEEIGQLLGQPVPG